MKKILFFLFCVLVVPNIVSAQAQTEFVIGAEWINQPYHIGQYSGAFVPTEQDWLNMLDLGLTWGHVQVRWPGWSYGTNDEASTGAILTAAQQHGMKISLEVQRIRPLTQGYRWAYQPEYANHSRECGEHPRGGVSKLAL